MGTTFGDHGFQALQQNRHSHIIIFWNFGAPMFFSNVSLFQVFMHFRESSVTPERFKCPVLSGYHDFLNFRIPTNSSNIPFSRLSCFSGSPQYPRISQMSRLFGIQCFYELPGTPEVLKCPVFPSSYLEYYLDVLLSWIFHMSRFPGCHAFPEN